MSGRLIPSNGVAIDVLFVTLGRQPPKVYETTTGAQGVYTLADITPGRYVVLITAGANAEVRKLPERYATATTSPAPRTTAE